MNMKVSFNRCKENLLIKLFLLICVGLPLQAQAQTLISISSPPSSVNATAVGDSQFWPSAGTVNGVPISLQATVTSLGAGDSLSFFTSGDNPVVRSNTSTFSATVVWEVFNAATGAPIVADPNFLITDIDGRNGSPIESASASCEGLTSFTVNDPTNINVSESNGAILGEGTQNQNGSQQEGFLQYSWNSVNQWTVNYFTTTSGRWFVHDADGDIPFDADPTLVSIVDLASIKSLVSTGATPPGAGDPVSWTVELSNITNIDASQAIVVDTLPSNVTFVSASATTGTTAFDAGANTLTWSNVDVLANSDETLTINAIVNSGTEGETVTNEAEVQLSTLGGASRCSSRDVSEVTFIVEDPQASLAIEKTAGTPTVALGGVDNLTDEDDTITYTYVVENTGNTTITDVVPIDAGPRFNNNNPQAGTGTFGPFSPVSATLAPGQSQTFTAVYTLSQDDVDNVARGNVSTIGVTNTATATGSPPVGVSLDPVTSSTAITGFEIDPNIDLVKDISNAGTFNQNGDLIDYTFTITNTGNITLTQVRPQEIGPTINGNGRSGFFPGPFLPSNGVTLAPGQSQVFTRSYQLSQNDVNNVVQAADPLTSIDNQFTAFGQGINSNNFPQNVISNTVETGFEAVPELTIVKSINGGPDGINSIVGPTANLDGVFDTIQYRWTVTNTGNVTTSNVTVSDVGPTFNGQPGTNNLSFINPSNVFLQPGQSQTFSAQYQLSQADVNNILAAPNSEESIENISSVEGSPFGSPNVTFDSNPITTGFSVDAELTLAKSVASPTTGAGSLSNLTDAGDTITYSFVVTNSGDVALDNITINDPGPTFNGQPAQGSLGPINCQNTTLSPNSSTTCTATYTLAQGDVDNAISGGPNSIDNTATAEGQVGGTPITSNDSSAETTIVGAPEIELTKTAGTISTALGADATLTDPGDTIDYTIVAENTGNTTLFSVLVSDSLVTVTCSATTSAGNPFSNDGSSSLEPGESVSCTAQYTLEQADIDAGGVVNTADVSSQDPSGTPTNASDQENTGLTQRTSVALTKTASPAIVPNADTDLIYNFTLDNTGNVSLTSPSVTDPLCTTPGTVLDINNGFVGGDTNNNSILDSDEIWEFSCTRDITQAEFDAAAGGDLTNTATGTGTPPAGLAPPQSNAGALVRAQENVGIALDKLAGLPTTDSVTDAIAGITDAGDTITYTFEVTNTSNVTLDNVTVADPLIDGAGGSVTCPIIALAPNESVTCTAVYEITQDDLDTGLVNNTATATATPQTSVPIDPPSAVSSAVVPLPAEPSLGIEKSVDPLPTPFEAGQVITYRYVVTNTGNVTVNDVEPIDAGPTFNSAAAVNSLSAFATTAADTTLAPGDDIEFTATYLLDQADIDNMAASATPTTAIDNSATANGVPENGSLAPVVPSEVETGVAPTPSLNLVKSALPPAAAIPAVGDVISYTFEVTNDGNVTITSPVVNDAICQPSTSLVVPDSGDDDGDGALDVGETFVYSCTYALQQIDLDAGLVENTATATGQDPAAQDLQDVSGSDATNDDPTITPLPQVSAWEVEKSTIDVPDSAGDTLDYTFTVSNNGSVSIGNIVVNDPKCASAPVLVAGDIEPNGLLSPAETFTYTCTSVAVTQDQVDAGEVVNTVSLSGTVPPNAPALPAIDDTLTTPIEPTPELTLDKSATAPTIGFGAISTATDTEDTIVYSFDVQNTGNVTLSSVSIIDLGPTFNGEVGTGVWSGLSCPLTTLLPLQTVTCTATYELSQLDIDNAIAGGINSVENTAQAQGSDPDNATVSSLPDTELVSIDSSPDVLILKDAGAPTVIGGGDSSITDPGDTIEFSITVENTGNTTLSNVMVEDNLAALDCPAVATPSNQPFTNTGDASSILAVGDTVICTATYTIDQADIDAGQVTNTATISSTDPSGTPVNGLVEEVSPFTQRTSIALTKTASVLPPDPLPGVIVTYSFDLENTGNVSLADARIEDDQCNQVSPPGILDVNTGLDADTDSGSDGVLSAGETWMFTCQYAITEEDILAAEIVNTATGSGTPPANSGLDDPSSTSSAIVVAEQNAAITLVKEASVPTTNLGALPADSDVGDTITYTFDIANTGNLQFDTISLLDPLITDAPNNGTITCIFNDGGSTPFLLESTILPILQSITCEAQYSLTQEDLDAGMVLNTATAAGDPPGDVPPPPQAQSGAVVPITPAPSLSVEKSASAINPVALGAVITYTYVVENTGNITINNVAPVDQGPTFNGVPGSNVLSAYSPLLADLAPGEQQTFEATYILSQQDLDNMAAAGAGAVTAVDNEATADGEPTQGILPPVVADVAETGAALDPSITLVKTSSVTAPVAAGSIITYSFALNNNGNVTISNPLLDDPLCQSPVAPLSFSQGFVDGDVGVIPQSLDVGETWQFECGYAVTQTDIDAGTVQNTAVASGQDPSGATVGDTSGTAADNDVPTDTLLPRTPLWTIDKSTQSSPTVVGDTLNYSFVVTNTGNTSISPVTVADAKCVGAQATLDVSSDLGSDGVLSPAGLAGSPAAEQWRYSCVSIPVTQSEVDAGQVINNVIASGSAPGGGLLDTSDQEITLIPPVPGMSLVKSAGISTLNSDGSFDQVFNFELKNTGNITLDNVSISDDIGAQFGACFDSVIASGVVTLIDAGELGGSTTPTLSTQPVLAVNQSLGVQDSISISNYVVRFNPNAPGCVFPDPALNSANGSSDQANDVSDNGTDPDAANPNDTGTPTPFVPPAPQPELGLAKSAAVLMVNQGFTFDAEYTLLLQNTGNVDLTEIDLSDDIASQLGVLFAASPASVPDSGVISAPVVTLVSDVAPLNVILPPANDAYSGGPENLFADNSGVLGVGDVIQIQFSVRIDPTQQDPLPQEFENVAQASATAPDGSQLSDLSNAGSDPSVGAGGEQDPTIITLEDVTALPITLGYFEAQPVIGGVLVKWQTQTEVSNLGFNVYAKIDDEWQKLNQSVVPGQGDSIELHNYELLLESSATFFALSDIDGYGEETLHGPFILGRAYGENGARIDTDWQPSNARRESKEEQRKARRKQQLLERNKMRRLKRAAAGGVQ